MRHRYERNLPDDVSDEELVATFQEGDERSLETLFNRYRGFARVKSRAYFIMGGDINDIEQEGLIGLFKAARDFRPDRQVSFGSFAELCITRNVISAIKKATRQKHQPLNQYRSVSASRWGQETNERPLEEVVAGCDTDDPAEEVVSREYFSIVGSYMSNALSGFELEVLKLYARGRTYQEIAEHLERHPKSVDNALQRIKRKLAFVREDFDLWVLSA